MPFELEDLDLAREEVGHELEALDDVDRLEQLLALLGGHVRAVRDHVGQQARFGDVASGDGGLGRHRRPVGDVLLDLRLDRAHEGLDLDARRRRIGQFLDGGHDVRAGLGEAIHAQAALALDDGTDGSVLELDDLGDLGERAHRVELARAGDVLLVGLALRDQRDGPTRRDGGVQGRDALVATDLERNDHLREDDRLAQSDKRKVPGGSLLVVPLLFDWGPLRRHQALLWCVAAGPAVMIP